MKKWMIICWMAMLMGWMPVQTANARTKDPSRLGFGPVKVEGCMFKDKTLRMTVSVVNTGDEDYVDNSWEIGLRGEAQSIEIWPYPLDQPIIEIPAGQVVEVSKLLRFPEAGHYELYALTLFEGQTIPLFSFSVDITEGRPLQVKTETQVDMLEQTADDTFIYGDFQKFRVTGIATVTNEEDFPLFPNVGSLGGLSGAIVTVFPSSVYPIAPDLCLKTIATELQPGETISVPFELELYNSVEDIVTAQQNDFHGVFYVGVQTPWTGMENATYIAFHPKECTLTYWTADGHVHPLTVGSESVVRVPAEATAVDLRGVYRINTIFTLDTSEANPNCLFFMNDLDYVRGLDEDRNIVRSYNASRIVVHDGSDFTTPMPFTSKMAWYRYPQPETSADGSVCSGTLTLPFQPTHIMLCDLNDEPMEVLHGECLKFFRYQGCAGGTISMKAVDFKDVRAYEPYLVCLTAFSQIDFVGEDYAFPATATALRKGCPSELAGTMHAVETSDFTYLYNPQRQCFCLAATGESVGPFRAYFEGMPADSVDEEYSVLFGDDTSSIPSAIAVPQAADYRQPVNAVYDLQGRRVDSSRLPKGLYIVNGKKVVIR